VAWLHAKFGDVNTHVVYIVVATAS